MAIILFTNLKGGVAKTTNAVAVAECLADAGHRVLVIDADHQCMAGELLLGESRMLHCERRKITLHDLFAAMLDDEFSSDQIAPYVVDGVSNIDGGLPNLSVIPCSIRIDEFSTNMAKAKRGHHSNDEFLRQFAKRRAVFKRWLNREYDFTIVDCPPSVNLQVRMMMSVADAYIVPSVPDRLSVRGSLWLLQRIRQTGVKLEGLGTLWSLYRKQNRMHVRTIHAAENRVSPYSELTAPFETIIPNSTAIADSTDVESPQTSFKKKYTPEFAKLYSDLCDEIVGRVAFREIPVNGKKLELV